MQVLNAICAITVIGFLALTVDGKHMQQEASAPVSVVARYAVAEPMQRNWINEETPEQKAMLLKLAAYMGRSK